MPYDKIAGVNEEYDFPPEVEERLSHKFAGINEDYDFTPQVEERLSQKFARLENGKISETNIPERLSPTELANTITTTIDDSPGWRQLRRDLLALHEALKGTPNLATRTAMGATLTGILKWYGGVLGPDGKIYGIPNNSTDILVIDPVAGTATRTTMGATFTGGGRYSGGVLGPNGKIYGIPNDATDILQTVLPVSTPFAYSPYFNKM